MDDDEISAGEEQVAAPQEWVIGQVCVLAEAVACASAWTACCGMKGYLKQRGVVES